MRYWASNLGLVHTRQDLYQMSYYTSAGLQYVGFFLYLRNFQTVRNSCRASVYFPIISIIGPTKRISILFISKAPLEFEHQLLIQELGGNVLTTNIKRGSGGACL